MKRRSAGRASALRVAAHRRAALVLSVAFAVSACHTAPPKDPPATPVESGQPPATPPAVADAELPAPSTEAVSGESPQMPPCVCVDSTLKPAAKRKPKPASQTPPPPLNAVTAVSAALVEPSVKELDSPSLPVLGRKVRGQDGEDLGRVVDILADRQGRVRIAVIEFGGFLGVGNRRIAVDWSLLRFQRGDADAPVTVQASQAQLQGTPEYKGSERPRALMAPAAPAAAHAAPP
jgi:hypothetical protein